ncbi:MAG: thioredoxin family protein [Promethearchaeia archaeon]
MSIIDIDSEEKLKKLISDKDNDKYSLIDVYTTWCGPCRWQKKVLEDYFDILKKIFPKLEIYSFNYELIENKEKGLFGFEIEGVPQLILCFKGKIIALEEGFTKIKELIEDLDNYIDDEDKNIPELDAFKKFILEELEDELYWNELYWDEEDDDEEDEDLYLN